MKFFKSFGLILCGALFIVSCSKNTEILDDLTTIETSNYDNQVAKLSEKVAVLVADTEFASFVKKEAEKQFDGDYNFLIKDVMTHTFSDGKTFANRVAGNETWLNELLEANPKLQIAVPVNIDKWDVKNYTPMVAYAKQSFDDQVDKTVTAFDSEGETTELSIETTPEVPVLAITLNERININADGSYDNPYRVTPESVQSTTPSKVRTYGGQEKVTRMKFGRKQLKKYESWISGGPELRLVVFGINNNNNQNGHEYRWGPSRSSINNSWYYPGNPFGNLFYWYGYYPTALAYTWVEEDGGNYTTITISASYVNGGFNASINIPLPIGNKDDPIGTNTVVFTDPEPSDYSAGGFAWRSEM